MIEKEIAPISEGWQDTSSPAREDMSSFKRRQVFSCKRRNVFSCLRGHVSPPQNVSVCRYRK